MRTCETCVFWRGTPAKPKEGNTPAVPAQAGPCKRNPPVAGAQTTRATLNIRPIMPPDDWCGEHMTAAEQVAEANRDTEFLEAVRGMIDGLADTLTTPDPTPQPTKQKGA